MAKAEGAASSSNGAPRISLCASCDRCRARKTKCDGATPCGNCAAKYLKKHKLTSIKGIDISLFECVYSPAKRRGPVPGRVGQARKASEALEQHQQQRKQAAKGGHGPSSSMMMGGGGVPAIPPAVPGLGATGLGGLSGPPQGMIGADQAAAEMLQQQRAQLAALGVGASGHGGLGGGQSGQGHLDDPMSLQRQLILQQAQAQHLALGFGAVGLGTGVGGPKGMGGMLGAQSGLSGASSISSQQSAAQQLSYLRQLQAQQQNKVSEQLSMQPPADRAKPSDNQAFSSTQLSGIQGVEMPGVTTQSETGLPKSVAKYISLLDRDNQDGNRLRSYYDLSVDELFCLPPIPSDAEYCSRLPEPINPSQMPRFDRAALRAARFAEISLGALVNDQAALALELNNAAVMCLRQCVEEPVHPSCMFDVARAYLLHGIFRSFRGDMVRYFKYRRICLTHLSQLDGIPGVEALLAAISYHDSWAYMIYNGSEDALPNIDDIPPLPPQQEDEASMNDAKFGTSTKPSAIASNPTNQMWIQGPPPVFINKEAPALSRSLDAVASAIRSCCDQARLIFDGKKPETNGTKHQPSLALTSTGFATESNKKELCDRNTVSSASTLLRQQEMLSKGTNKNHGLHLILSLMDAFFEDSTKGEGGELTDSQIQNLLMVCNLVIEHPLLLHHGGPTYHMVSNAAIMLCHVLNGMHGKYKIGSDSGEMESVLFGEIFDAFVAVRKLLTVHRKKLPAKLRCHGIPLPNIAGTKNRPFVDFQAIAMCSCATCQSFVFMACSPCVAAERAEKGKLKAHITPPLSMNRQNAENEEDFDKELVSLVAQFNRDDEALLSVLSRIIAA